MGYISGITHAHSHFVPVSNRQIVKSITETVTVGETAVRALGKVRTKTETTTIGESVARKNGKTRSKTETVTVGETAVRKKGLTRAPATETVTVSGGTLARVLGKVRAISQTTTIGELLTRIVGRARAPATETVTVSGGTVSRQVGKTRVAGVQRSILLDGVNDYLTAGAQTGLWSQTLTKFTISIWARPSDLYALAFADILGIVNPADTTFSTSLYFDSTNLVFDVTIDDYVTAGSAFTPDIQKNDVYYNFICVFDSTLGSNHLKLFVDTVQKGQDNYANAIPFASAAQLEIGHYPTDPVGSFHLKGNVKDFRVWINQALDATNRSKVYNNDPTAPAPSYWLKMQEGSGNPVDAISGSLTATLQSGAAWDTKAPPVWTYETVPVGESVNRSAGKNRSIIENTAISELLARIKGLIRALATETVVISEQLVKTKGLPRAPAAETVASSESVERQKGLSRSISQTVTSGELLTRIKGLIRSIIDSVTITEDVQKSRGSNRTLPESTTIGEAVSRSKGSNRTLPESVASSEAVTRQKGITKSIIENVIIAELITRIKGLSRAIIQNITVTEDVTKTKALPRAPAAENTTIGEQVDRAKGVNRSLPENVASSESVTRQKGISRLISQTVTIAEQVVRALGKVRSIIETVIISENLASVKTGDRNRGITETVPVGESVTRAKGTNRSITQNVVISELVTNVKGIIKAITESVTVSGTVNRIKGLTRAIIQTITVNGTVTRKKEASRTLSQSVVINEDLQKQRGKARIISETISVFASLERSVQKTRSIIQTVVVTGTVTALKRAEILHIVRAITETVPVSELLTRMKGIHREIGEVVGSIIDFMREDHGPIDGLMCALLKQNWVIQNPAQHEINWSSWYTGDDDISIHCGPVTMLPRPVNMPWDLFDYDSYCMVNVFVTDITGNNGQPRLDRIRKQIEDTINGNPNALDANGIDMIKIDSIFSREDSSSDYKDNYKSDIFRLIIRINLKHIKKF